MSLGRDKKPFRLWEITDASRSFLASYWVIVPKLTLINHKRETKWRPPIIHTSAKQLNYFSFFTKQTQLIFWVGHSKYPFYCAFIGFGERRTI